MQIIFHEFSMGDVEDVDIYVAEPIYRWQQSAQGRWAMSNAQDLKYYTSPDVNTMGYRVTIRGELQEGPLLTEYFLKYGHTV